jgi:hypothetical protein
MRRSPAAHVGEVKYHHGAISGAPALNHADGDDMKLHMPHAIAVAALLAMLTASGPPAGPASVPDHSVSGVVKFVDRTKLVITRAGKIPVEMTFSVNASTQHEGPIVVGAKVQVRFRGDGHPAAATAILVTPPRARQMSGMGTGAEGRSTRSTRLR